jgi:hypothetical protein
MAGCCEHGNELWSELVTILKEDYDNDVINIVLNKIVIDISNLNKFY